MYSQSVEIVHSMNLSQYADVHVSSCHKQKQRGSRKLSDLIIKNRSRVRSRVKRKELDRTMLYTRT